MHAIIEMCSHMKPTMVHENSHEVDHGCTMLFQGGKRQRSVLTFCPPHVFCSQSSVTGAANPFGFSNITCPQSRDIGQTAVPMKYQALGGLQSQIHGLLAVLPSRQIPHLFLFRMQSGLQLVLNAAG